MSLGARLFQTIKVLRASTRGGAALELAVVFPFLLLLIIGAVDYGRMYLTSVTVANAARAGAEFGAQDISTSQNVTKIKSFALLDSAETAGILKVAARTYCECGKAAHTCDACSDGQAPDIYVEVTATDTLTTLLSYPGLPKKIPIIRKVTFRSQ